MRKLGLAGMAFAIAISMGSVVQAQQIDAVTVVAGIGGYDFLKAVEDVGKASSFSIQRFSQLPYASLNANRLASVVQNKPYDVRALQSALSLNPMAVAALRGAGIPLGYVVSLVSAGDGAVTLIVDDL